MSQRVAKMESLIQSVVAAALAQGLEADAARVTVTRVDAAPDLRNATVWVGMIVDQTDETRLWEAVERQRGAVQAALGSKLETKFVPRLHFKHDTGGEYAAEIDRLLRQL
jgi:ribosome-binding factor A